MNFVVFMTVLWVVKVAIICVVLSSSYVKIENLGITSLRMCEKVCMLYLWCAGLLICVAFIVYGN